MARPKKHKRPLRFCSNPTPGALPDPVDPALLEKVRTDYADRWVQLPRETWSSNAALQLLDDATQLDREHLDMVCSDSAIQCVRDYFAAMRAMRAFGRLDREIENPNPDERQV